MFETVDLYCERVGPGLWAEPVNACTNAAFFLCAWLAFQLAKRWGLISPAVNLLLILIFAIGVGSSLFHTFATNWARVIDVSPILIFQMVYIWLYCRRIILLRFGYSLVILVLYLVAAIVGRQFPHFLNGSLIYAPAFLVISILGFYHVSTRKCARYVLATGAGIFLASLTFRTIDGLVCPYFPLGTHFLWHVFNAILLYLLMRGFLANISSPGDRSIG